MAKAFWLSVFILVSIAGGSWRAQAQSADDLVSFTGEGASSAKSAVEAAREIQSTVVNDMVRSEVTNIIGEKRYQKNKGLVEGKIVKQSAKFIPFVNAGQPSQQPDGTWKMSIQLKISISSLRKMIVDNGLLNDANGPASILPMIAVVDRKSGVALRWWQGEVKDEAHKLVSQVSARFLDRLQDEFSRQGFHVIKPLGAQFSPLPEAFRADRPSGADLVFASDFYGAPLILRGDVRFRETKDGSGRLTAGAQVAIKLEVLQANTGRVVAEVSRQFDADSGAYEAAVRSKVAGEGVEIAKDLASQVFEAWQRGTLSSNLVRLAIRGQLTPKQLTEFRNGLLQGVRDVKNLKERMFEAGQVVFEVDYAGERPQLEEKLKGLKLTAFETRLGEAGERGVVVDVKAR